LVGDSAGFVDPVWSSGVYLATTGAVKAAKAIGNWMGSGDEIDLRNYETSMQRTFETYRNFVKYFYGLNRKPEDYFWKAYQLVPGEANEHDAFRELCKIR